MEHILRIIGVALHYKYRLAFAYLCSAGALVAYVFLPEFFGRAIDDIVDAVDAGGDIPADVVLTSVVIIMVLGVIRGVLSYGQTYLGESLSQYVS